MLTTKYCGCYEARGAWDHSKHPTRSNHHTLHHTKHHTVHHTMSGTAKRRLWKPGVPAGSGAPAAGRDMRCGELVHGLS